MHETEGDTFDRELLIVPGPAWTAVYDALAESQGAARPETPELAEDVATIARAALANATAHASSNGASTPPPSVRAKRTTA